MKLTKIIYYLGLGVVSFSALLLTFSAFPIPGNYRVLTVLSGSMQPKVKVGSLVVVEPAADYEVGDVITFKDTKNPAKLTTHRIVEKNVEDSRTVYITKGDANNAPDSEPVSTKNVLGKVYFTLPYFGYAVNTVKQPFGFFILIILPATLIIYDEIRKIKNEIVKLRQKKTLIFLLFFSVSMLSIGATTAFISDTEISAVNVFSAASWDVWKQTTQEDFEAGSLANIDTTTSPEDARLTGAYPVDGDTVALWHFNEGSGTSAADSADSHDGTLNGDPQWVPGKYSNALEFDGDGDYVEVPDDDGLDLTGAITVEAWINSDTWEKHPNAPIDVRNILDKGEHKSRKAFNLYAYKEA